MRKNFLRKIHAYCSLLKPTTWVVGEGQHQLIVLTCKLQKHLEVDMAYVVSPEKLPAIRLTLELLTQEQWLFWERKRSPAVTRHTHTHTVRSRAFLSPKRYRGHHEGAPWGTLRTRALAVSKYRPANHLQWTTQMAECHTYETEWVKSSVCRERVSNAQMTE